MNKKTARIILSLIVVSLIVTIILKNNPDNETTNYSIVKPVIGDLKKDQLISGIIVPSKEIEIKPQISGILKKLFVKVGDKVEIGDEIASIEIIANPKNLESASNNVKIAEINFNNEKKRYERSKTLFQKGVIAQVENENVKQSFLLKKESLKSAREQLYIAEKGFSKNQVVTNIIKTTAKGIVLELPLKEGASITERNNFNQGSTVAIIADLESVLFKGKINENDILYLKDKMTFDITINALDNLKVLGILKSVSPKGVFQNGIMKFDIIASVSIPKKSKKQIRSGYTAIANIILEEKNNVLTVEENDLIFEKDSVFVEVVSKDQELIKTFIKTGLSDGVKIEVLEGVDLKSEIKKQ